MSRTAIWNVLLDLQEDQFHMFCYALTYSDEEPRIRASEVEQKSRIQITELLVQRCCLDGAVSRTIQTLRDIGCYNSAEILAKEADLPPRTPPEVSSTALRKLKTGSVGSVSRAVAKQLLDNLLDEGVLNFEEKENALDTAGPSKSTDIYPVTSKSIKNRVALLITNITFTNGIRNRRGAEKDEENMEKLLSTLGYEVVKHRDLTAQEMNDALVEFSKHPKLKETDSVFVVISSHGKLGAVLGVSHKPDEPDELKLDDIYDNLNAKGCPALVDKPKIVIIQACRGNQSGSVLVCDNMEADAVPCGDIEEDVVRYTHKENDFLAFLSSTPHTVSYRHKSQGSYLIRLTVDVFKTNVLKDHIEELFRKVMKKFKEGKELPDPLRQMPTKDRCTLAQHFFLFPGALKQHYPVVGQRDQCPGPSVSMRCSSGAVDGAITALRDIGCNNKVEELGAQAAPRRDRSHSPLRAKPSLSRDDSSPSPQNDPKELLSSVRVDFVDNVSDAVLDQLLDRLLRKKLLNSGEVESAKQKHRPEKARHVVDTVLRKGSKAASFLIKEYCDLDSCSELCDQLKL